MQRPLYIAKLSYPTLIKWCSIWLYKRASEFKRFSFRKYSWKLIFLLLLTAKLITFLFAILWLLNWIFMWFCSTDSTNMWRTFIECQQYTMDFTVRQSTAVNRIAKVFVLLELRYHVIIPVFSHSLKKAKATHLAEVWVGF